MLDLAGDWTLADARGEYDLPMAVPGDVHSALFAAGRIPDPYAGRNEYDLRWVADRDWTLSRRFTLPPGDGPWTLFVDTLDTVAEIRINDRFVVAHETAFRELVVAVTDAVEPGENRIDILLRSATRHANALQAAQPFKIPYHAGNCPIPNGNMLRKPQCDFGWDWNIALVPVGVYGGIRLVGPEGCIGGVDVQQRHHADRVTLTVRVDLVGGGEGEIPWRIAIGDEADSGEIDAGNGCFWTEIELIDPDLWWPAGYGAPSLHTIEIQAGREVRRMRVALRDIRLLSEPDAVGRSFGLSVNGRPVFARGANWIPADALPGRITAIATRDLLESAAAANMNMIRVWGGGRYEPASFYEACDELGLMVWQDFMFACHLYPSTDAFLREVEAEAGFQLQRIGRHVALWCGDNELLGALNWFTESVANRDRYLVAYDRLNHTLEKAVASAPGANWWPSSPSPGPMSFGDAWHDDTSGDMHFWSVWHEGRDFEHYRDVKPRFCSEFGFQSYASLDVIRSFAGDADLNIASPVIESHQKNAGGNARIAETMFRYFRFPEGFANFVWLSQVQQGVAIKTAVDYWRSLKPHCNGALYWQLGDTWPVASWSSLDYGGGWKLLHHMARRFFAPVTVAAIPEAGAFRVAAVNDTLDPVDVDVTLVAADMAGATRPLATANGTVGPDAASTLATIPAGALAPGEILAWRWTASNGAAGGDHAAPVRYKALDLRDPGLAIATESRDGALIATLTAQALALFVTLEADRPGRFSTNAVTLFPGHPAEIAFTPRDGDPLSVTLTARDLWSSAQPTRGSA